MSLTNDRATGGLGAEVNSSEPELSWEELMQASQAVQFRTADDMIKTLAVDEEQLSKMPMATQPASLRATLLPYQLQVSLKTHSAAGDFEDRLFKLTVI